MQRFGYATSNSLKHTNMKSNLYTIFSILILITLSSCQTDPPLVEEEMTFDSSQILLEIGDEGPAGGIVFFDKGEFSDGWQYIEVAPNDMDEGAEWGCFEASIEEAQNKEIGAGKSNSMAIVDFHDSFNNFYENPEECSEISNGTVAAKSCIELELGGFSDWYLPSSDEVFEMYEKLHLNGLGNFLADDVVLYWSSTQHDSNTAIATDFATADQGFLCKQCAHIISRFRAVRYF